jgi:hypothetical protein
MNGYVKRELPPSALGRHFEFHRKHDGEVVELIAGAEFAGEVPDPSVLVNPTSATGAEGEFWYLILVGF